MKRLLLAIALLAGGTTLFSALHHNAREMEQACVSREVALRVQQKQLAHLRRERDDLRERLRQEGHTLWARPTLATGRLAEEFAAGKLTGSLSSEQAERLLADLGFNWHTSRDYLIISKSSLSEIWVKALSRAKLTEAARVVLAITPGEQGAIEAEVQRLNAEYAAWSLANIKREEPSGDLVAKYILEMDPEFSRELANAFVHSVVGSLGEERGQLLLRYAQSWMADLGMHHATDSRNVISMTIRRYQVGDRFRLGLTLQHPDTTMSTDISRHQPVPQTFRPLFPNGWRDVAAREGFELPKDF